VTSAGGITGEELRVDAEAMRNLIEGGRQAGVDVRKLAPTASYRMDSGQNLDDDTSRREINRAFEAVQQAGGDPFGGAPTAAARALRRAADALDDLVGDASDSGREPPFDGRGAVPARR
jgi:hypothetical protein